MFLPALFVAVSLKAMETKTANTVLAPATADPRRCGMSKALAVIHYAAAMAVFRKWVAARIISEDELIHIETVIAPKYGLSERSIYRQKA